MLGLETVAGVQHAATLTTAVEVPAGRGVWVGAENVNEILLMENDKIASKIIIKLVIPRPHYN